MSYSLDSWAVLEWLSDVEPAASRVEEVLQQRPLMSWINLGEVFYVVARRRGERAAGEVLAQLRPQLSLDLPSRQRILQAARIKAAYPVAYADAFAVATAIARNTVLLTGDDEILTADTNWPTQDVRRP
ncbi:MAG: type II toxin-antitoxin system VapC family toxin [Actinomycetota bacterium]